MGLSPRHYETFRKQAREYAESVGTVEPVSEPVTYPSPDNHGTYTLFVGADPHNGELDEYNLTRVLDERHEGYTWYRANGSWRGTFEPSAVVVISDNRVKVLETAAILRDELNQESVGVVESPPMYFV